MKADYPAGNNVLHFPSMLCYGDEPSISRCFKLAVVKRSDRVASGVSVTCGSSM